jgi:ribosomal protein S6--L-glutamate ligase
VNPPAVLLRGYDRLSMLNELQEAGLPLLEMTAALGEGMLDRFEPDLPAVVKVGNYHGGYGKARPREAEEWADIKDVAFTIEDYVTVEPYVAYVRDIRCLAVGEQVWAMARRGRFWKANTTTEHYELVPVPPVLHDYTRQAMDHFQADILGLDFLETAEHDYVLLESNDTPGLAGFPEETRVAVARAVRGKLDG